MRGFTNISVSLPDRAHKILKGNIKLAAIWEKRINKPLKYLFCTIGKNKVNYPF